jgi:phosphoribosylanthranilate isomerase
MSLRIKICCISSEEEAKMAVAHGADALGLVGAMPSGPGVISDEKIAQIVSIAPPGVATFLLTSETKANDIVAHHQKVHTSTIQLVDSVPDSAYAAMRAALPAVKVVQVIHVMDERAIEEAIRAAEFADAILLDSGNPNLAIKELGGTGRVHDWSLSRMIRNRISKPVFLAGGLRAENVRAAIETVEPFGLDLCSGVRSEGRLDPHKLDQFFQIISQTV